MVERFGALSAGQVLGIAALWPCLLGAAVFADVWVKLGRPDAVHVDVFASGWVLLVGPSALIIGLWLFVRRRA